MSTGFDRELYELTVTPSSLAIFGLKEYNYKACLDVFGQ
jgi:hypothetical protein